MPTKITLEVEELKTLVDGLNNAIIAYNEVVMALYLCCEVPSCLAPLKLIPFENLRERQKALGDIYKQLEQIEKENKD